MVILVNAHTGARLRPALDIEIAAIRATRYGVKIIDLRCGALSCRLETVRGPAPGPRGSR